MKHIFTLLIVMSCLCRIVCSQTTTITSNLNVDKLVIAENTTLINTAKITISDSLIIYGTLINNGIIYAQEGLVSGGTICSHKKDSIKITNDLTLANAYITSTDSINSVNITTANIYINDYTTIESAYITTNNLIINDTLEFTGKIGVKTVLNDFIINGCFKNTDNENIVLYGNAINNSPNLCTNANFELWGTDKYITGNFSCYRIDLEKETSTYTNYGSITVTTSFSGKGTLTQGTNSFLEIKTTTSPKIIAKSEGNTVSYTRGGNQTINCNEFYNLIISKDRTSSIVLSQNTSITNSLSIEKKAFIDCNNYELYIQKAQNINNEEILPQETTGIFLRNGKITIDIEPNQNVFIPLLTNDTTIANLSLKNPENEKHTYIIDSVFNFITYSGISTDEHIEQEFIQTTWHLLSDANKVQIGCFWSTKNELPYFISDSSTIYQSTGKGWKSLPYFYQNQAITHKPEGYFTVGNHLSFLPISIYEVSIQEIDDYVEFRWKSEQHNTITIEKSYNGISFFKLAEITNTNGNFHYCEKQQKHNGITYYRFSTQDNKGHTEHSTIYQIKSNNNFSIDIDKTTETIFCNYPTDYSITIYDSFGNALRRTQNTPISLHNLPHGIYFITAKNATNKITQKILW